MLTRVPVPLKNVHRFKSEMADADEAAHEYEQTLGEFLRLGKGQLPRFDLSCWEWGGTDILPQSSPTRMSSMRRELVVAPWIEKLKGYRITLTPPVLRPPFF